MRKPIPNQTPARNCIDIYVDRIEQLFNSMDPSPFQEKDLDSDAEEFIVSWAREYHPRAPLCLRVRVNRPTAAGEAQLLQTAIHNYFSYRRNLNRLAFKRLMKQGRVSLVIGGAFLAVCLLISDLLAQQQLGPFLSITRESLTIAGWVAMWQPMQIFLYDWWPLRRIGLTYQKLSQVPVAVQSA